MTFKAFQKMALAFPEATEEPHFELTSFRVKKKIFATYNPAQQLVCIRLSLTDQDVFCSHDRSVIYPVPNKWGLQGATYFQLKKVRAEILKDALTLSYRSVAPKKLIELLDA